MNMFFPDTPARRVIQIIRIIRSYGLALRHPAAPARHRSPRQGRDSSQEKSFGEPARHSPACPAYQGKIKSSPPQNIEVVVWGEDLQLFLPMAARPQLPGTRPRLPGIEASSLPSLHQGI